MWKYEQASGKLINPAGSVICLGYSGRGEGLNNASMQHVGGVGPIPQGAWEVGRFSDDLGGKGRLVCNLVPADGTETHGRSGFMIHGDNSHGDRSASHGCIILPRLIREQILASSDRTLEVTA